MVLHRPVELARLTRQVELLPRSPSSGPESFVDVPPLWGFPVVGGDSDVVLPRKHSLVAFHQHQPFDFGVFPSPTGTPDGEERFGGLPIP